MLAARGIDQFLKHLGVRQIFLRRLHRLRVRPKVQTRVQTRLHLDELELVTVELASIHVHL
jgi:hypothetical protein